MSARELIKQVAALPPQERTLFLQLLDRLKSAPLSAAGEARQNWPDFGQRLRRIYGDKVALDSQSIIDDGRGDR
jgi:hypothetical protein